MKFGWFVFVILAGVSLAAPVFAHHGTGVAYDTEKTLILKGTVTEWIWANPHCGILFDVTNDKGEVLGRRTRQSSRPVHVWIEQGRPQTR